MTRQPLPPVVFRLTVLTGLLWTLYESYLLMAVIALCCFRNPLTATGCILSRSPARKPLTFPPASVTPMWLVPEFAAPRKSFLATNPSIGFPVCVSVACTGVSILLVRPTAGVAASRRAAAAHVARKQVRKNLRHTAPVVEWATTRHRPAISCPPTCWALQRLFVLRLPGIKMSCLMKQH